MNWKAKIILHLHLIFVAANVIVPAHAQRSSVPRIGISRSTDPGTLELQRSFRRDAPESIAARLRAYATERGIPSRERMSRAPEPVGVPAPGTRVSLRPHLPRIQPAYGLDQRLAGASGPGDRIFGVLVELDHALSLDEAIRFLENGFAVTHRVSDRAIILLVRKNRLMALAGLPFVRGVTPLLPEHKFDPSDPTPDDGLLAVHPIAAGRDEYRAELISSGYAIRSFDPVANIYLVAAPKGARLSLASLYWVGYVAPVAIGEAEAVNFEPDDAREIVGSSWIWRGDTGSLGAPRYTGRDIRVGMIDEGFNELHPDFSGDTKVLAGSDLGGSDPSVNREHGTHVAGLIASRSGSRTLPGRWNSRGVAHDAQVAFFSGFSAVMARAFTFFNANNIVVSNHSWGASSTHGYSSTSQTYDAWMVETGSQLMFKSAGNSGSQATITAPGTGKNLLVIGALNQVTDATLGQTLGEIASYSSRGPTRDENSTSSAQGRLKPDLVAPGGGSGGTLGVVSANGFNDPGFFTPSTAYWETDTYYLRMSGTSMAAPLATGSAALVQEMLMRANPGNPGAARNANLIKALLINTALPLTGNSGSNNRSGYANTTYGYGLVNPYSAIYDVAGENVRLLAETGLVILTTRDSETRSITVPAGAKFLAATLAYNDIAGNEAGGATGDLKDDLDLVLVEPGGTEHRYDLAGIGGNATYPSPLEKITIQNPAAGNWNARVEYVTSFDNIPNISSREYAIVAHAILAEPALAVTVPADTIIVETGGVVILTPTFTNTGGHVAAAVSADLAKVSGMYDFTGDVNRVFFINTLPFAGAADTRTFTCTAPVYRGTYRFMITARGINRFGAGAATKTITVIVGDTTPNPSAPIPRATITKANIVLGETTTLDGATSSDSDGESLTYAWTISPMTGVTVSDTAQPSITFSSAESTLYAIILRVRDRDTTVAAETIAIRVVRMKGDIVGANSATPDARIDSADVKALLPFYGRRSGQSEYDPSYDLNADGVISHEDYLLLGKSYGQ